MVEEPGARDGAVVAAAHVAQADAAVAGVVVAEGVAAPVVAVGEGAGVGEADGVRDVLDVVLAAVADGLAVHPGDGELLAHDHLAVPGVVAGLAGGDRDGPDDLAVLGDLHRVLLGVHDGDLVAADGELHGLVLLAVDAVAALDAVQVEVDGDLGAFLPVLLGAEVQAVVAEPVALDVDGRLGLDADGLLDRVRAGDAPGEAYGERHPDADRGAVLGGEVADEGVLRGQRGEGGVLGGLAALGVLGDRVHRVLGAGGQMGRRRPGGAAAGYRALDLLALGVLDGDLGQLAPDDADLERPAGVDAGGTGLGRDADRGRGLLALLAAGALALPVPGTRVVSPAARGERQHQGTGYECQSPTASPPPSRRPRHRPRVHVVLPSSGPGQARSPPHCARILTARI